MREIREINESELDDLLRITLEAFPGMAAAQQERAPLLERLKAIMRQPMVHFFGVFEGAEMVGVMRCYDFTMKLHSTRTLLGGIGGVAVDLRHKKEHIAADMLAYFHDYYRAKGAALTALYPFRPDFYKRMGYGFGTKINRYMFKPEALPPGNVKANVAFLDAADKADLLACYDRLVERTNGLLEMPPHVLDSIFTDRNLRVLGYRRDGRLEGYMIFSFEQAHSNNFLLNNMIIRALVYDHATALAELLAFARSQADQFDRIVYETQDDHFFFLLSDPRNTSGNLLKGLWHEVNDQGVGIMYRVVDTRRYFEVLAGHDFGGQTGMVRVELTDSFLPASAGHTLVAFEDGRATVRERGAADVTIRLDVSEFSSLVVGAIRFAQLHRYGLAAISDPAYVPMVDRLFHTDQPPLCMTHF